MDDFELDTNNELNDDDFEVVEVDPEFEAELEKAEKDVPRVNEQGQIVVNYIDKAELQQAFVDWYADIVKAEEEGRVKPEVPKYIQRSIIQICENTSRRWNFVNYPFREDMVLDAIENIIKYIDRYDINNEKQNPFGYFSFVAWRAMVRRIKAEKHRASQHYHYIMNSGVLDSLELQDHDDGEAYNNMLQHYQSNVNDSLANYTQNKPKPRKKKGKDVVDVEGMLEDMFGDTKLD